MNHGRSCYPTWMRGAIWRAATSLPSQPEAAAGRQKYQSRVSLRMPRFASNLARPARKVKHTLACAVPLSVRSRPRVRFRSTQTSVVGRLQPFRASLPKPRPLHRNNQDLVDYFSAKLDQSPQTRLCLPIEFHLPDLSRNRKLEISIWTVMALIGHDPERDVFVP